MRTLAIGDIHGSYQALETLTKSVRLSHRDRVITLGDYIDRGPQSADVLNWLTPRWRAGWLIPLLGNHEILMLEARKTPEAFGRWQKVGGAATLASYGVAGGGLEIVPPKHWSFLEGCRRYFETETHFFVHANAEATLLLQSQADAKLFWERLDRPEPHRSGKVMVCGHTPQRSGRPWNLGHAICIDTGAYDGGWLTCLDVVSGHYWQANEQRETREGHCDKGISERPLFARFRAFGRALRRFAGR